MSVSDTFFSWADFETEAPELAARGRERIARFGIVHMGTIRRDGTPRISPIDAHFVRGSLTLVMIPGTHKLADVRRDPRIVLNALVHDAANHVSVEFKIRGCVVAVDDAKLRTATADTIAADSGWRPPEHWAMFAVEVENAAYIEWEKGLMRMDHWARGKGLDYVERSINLQ